MKSWSTAAVYVLVLAGIAAVLGIASIPRLTDYDYALACYLSILVAATCILLACIVYADRFGWKRRLVEIGSPVSNEDGFVRDYRSYRRRSIIFILAMVLLVIVLAGYSICLGQRQISFTGTYEILWNHILGVSYEVSDPRFIQDIIVWDVNLPRALVTIIAGCSLAVGGAVMQNAVRNPLADPYTTGISSGAVLGVAVAMVLGITVSSFGGYGIVINAFVFSLIPALLMTLISRISNGSAVTIILVGTALSYIFSSLTTLLMIQADETTMDAIFTWQVGSLSGMTWNTVPVMFYISVVCVIALYLMSNKLNLLMMGDDDAKALGLNINNFRTLCLILVSLLTASVVSFTGIIGFLGLLCPHIVRLIVGSDTRLVIPSAAALGTAVLFIADIISRTAADRAMPVGVVMSFIGGPLFLLLVLRMRRGVIE